MRALIVRTGNSPFEVWLLGAAVIAGVGGLVNPGASRAVARVLPDWQLYTWYSGLIVTAGIALLGVVLRSLLGLLLERAGLVLLAALTVIYAIAIVAAGGEPLTLSAALAASLGCACLARAWQIGKDLKRGEEVEQVNGRAP